MCPKLEFVYQIGKKKSMAKDLGAINLISEKIFDIFVLNTKLYQQPNGMHSINTGS